MRKAKKPRPEIFVKMRPYVPKGKYTGEMLRELRKERGVGRPPKILERRRAQEAIRSSMREWDQVAG